VQTKKFVICGNASAKGISDDPKNDIRLRLSSVKGEGNVTLRIEDIHSKMFSSVPTKFHDLLEIATYVYSADQVILRGADDVDSFGDGWRRDLHFVVPVRHTTRSPARSHPTHRGCADERGGDSGALVRLRSCNPPGVGQQESDRVRPSSRASNSSAAGCEDGGCMSDDRELLPCPFCGMSAPDDLIDTLYPSGTYRRYDIRGFHHYVSMKDRKAGDEPCWEMNCTENMGGCGAEMHANSRAEVIAKWNTRAAASIGPTP